jgi:uncharacterized protein (TIGR02452 family)
MIKRNGVEVMNERTKNVSIAKETLEILKRGNYTSLNGETIDISASLDAALKGTILYKDPLPLKITEYKKPTLEVTNETTAQAAFRLGELGKTDIVALNFASARNPGGGFLAGAIAQEEDLSRASGLYACVKSKPIFYNENILCDDTFYTDNIIYSPKVPFFRNEFNLFIEKPFELSIISAPAPNVRSMENIDLNVLSNKLYDRAIKILQIADKHGHKNIILGAWGCGAFGNDSSMVAKVFLLALQQVPTFEHVCFAVFDNKPEFPIYTAFKGVIG